MKSLKHRIFLFLIVLMSFMGQPLSAYNNPQPETPAFDEATGYYLIESYAHLLWLAQEVNAGTFDETGVNVRLTEYINANEDVDFDEVLNYVQTGENKPSTENYRPWTPIGTSEHPFKGIFDGNGNTIYMLLSNLDESENSFGFIGEAKDAVIQDITITYCIFVANQYCAPVVAVAQENVQINRVDSYWNKVTLTTEGEGYTGGVAAITKTSDCSVSNCMCQATWSVAYYQTSNWDCNYGGFVGSNSGTVSNCYLASWSVDVPYMICKVNYAGDNALTNCYSGDNGYTELPAGMHAIRQNSVISGHLCYLLNGSVSGGTNWRQNLNSGAIFPIPGTPSEADKVYCDYGCIFYNNPSGTDPIERYSIIQLCEGTNFNVEGTISAEKVKFDRTTSQYQWHTICVPFKIEASQNTDLHFYMIDNIEGTQSSEYVVNLRPVDEIPANTPGFIYKNPENDGRIILSAEGDTDNPIQLGGEAGVVTFGDFEFRGVYEADATFEEEQTNTGRYYFISKNALWRGINPFSIKPFRAYLYCTKADMGAAPMRFTLNPMDETSAIDALEDVAPHSQHVTDLMGRPASPDAKGLLITNHKKLLVK